MPRGRHIARTLLQPLAIAIALALLVRAAVRIYSIPSASMAPTLYAGDHIIVTPYLRGTPERGHVVVFRSPADIDELLVKRVVAVPGDVLESHLGQVRIGGHTVPESYLARPASTGAIGTQIIPGGCYYVMGDNRDDSHDSRSWGVVPRERIVGRARLILWSSTRGDGATAVGATTTSTAPVRSGAEQSRRLFKWIE